MNNKTIEQKIQRTEKEITRLEHQKKIKQHEAKQLERNRRIFTRGGMLERFMQRPLLLTDDQVYRLLQTAFNTEAVKELEKALITEAAQVVIQSAQGRAGRLGQEGEANCRNQRPEICCTGAILYGSNRHSDAGRF